MNHLCCYLLNIIYYVDDCNVKVKSVLSPHEARGRSFLAGGARGLILTQTPPAGGAARGQNVGLRALSQKRESSGTW